MLSWSWVLLTLTTLVSVHQVTCARGHRAARLSSIWDIILPPKQSSQPISDIQTNKINTQEKHKITVQASKLKSKPKSVQRERTQSTSTAKSLVQISSSDEGKRKLLLNLMDVYQCPTRGVFPIDGDCERFLMCRNDKRVEGRIKGKIYRCPKGYLFSSVGARCQPEDSVACHRSHPLHSLMRHAHARGDLLLLP